MCMNLVCRLTMLRIVVCQSSSSDIVDSLSPALHPSVACSCRSEVQAHSCCGWCSRARRLSQTIVFLHRLATLTYRYATLLTPTDVCESSRDPASCYSPSSACSSPAQMRRAQYELYNTYKPRPPDIRENSSRLHNENQPRATHTGRTSYHLPHGV